MPRQPRELFERCTVCGGSGRIDPARWQGWRHRPRPGSDGRVECPACSGEKFVKIGVTAGQLEKLVDRYRHDKGDPAMAPSDPPKSE